MVDFETAKRDCSPAELEAEMNALKSNLEDTSFRGGVELIQQSQIQDMQASVSVNSEGSEWVDAALDLYCT